ncbi:hypothetical protein EW145_g7288 [Phellinidium pouzarii]|uniref:CCHC-type domain-containing protein n=1 Tax=Phellinidium pouzarii TaxID=167371 RepID=A0A4S4KLJ3_9AGAM|nr:hypothetical protein EW145_g7288 [Phellinidium pouzarii]
MQLPLSTTTAAQSSSHGANVADTVDDNTMHFMDVDAAQHPFMPVEPEKPVTYASGHPGQTIHLPARYRDKLPTKPIRVDNVVTSIPEVDSNSSNVNDIALRLSLFRSKCDKYGLYCVYKQVDIPLDLRQSQSADTGTFINHSRLLLYRQPHLNPSLYAPHPNYASFLINQWFWAKHGQMQENLNRLQNIIIDNNILPEDLASVNFNQINKKLSDSSLDDYFNSDDGWRSTPFKIPIPLGHLHPDAPIKVELPIKEFYHRSLTGIICSVFGSKPIHHGPITSTNYQTNSMFHLEPPTQPNQPPHWFYLTNDPEDAAIHFEIAVPNYCEIFEETHTPNPSPIQPTIELPTPPVSNIQQRQPQSTPLPHTPSTSTTSSHIPLSPQPTLTPLVNMSTPAPTGEARLSKPNNFDGDKSCACRFPSSCQAYLSLNERIYNTDKSKIIFVLSFMQEKAAGDWATNRTTVALAPNPTTNTPTGFGTWVDFLNDFRNTFITTDDSADARCKLLNIKQTGTADNYNTQFRSLVTRSNISDKNALSEMYQQGLTHGLIQRIYARDKLPDTMEEWYQAASRADNLYRRLQALNATSTTTTSSTPRSTRFKNLFSTTTSSSPTPTNSPNRPKKLTPEEREKCIKEGRCLACREVGHNARDCTKYKARTPTTIRQVAPDPVPTTPAPVAAEPAKPTSKAEIIAHIRSLLQNAGDNVAEEVLMELDNTDF